MLARVRVVLFVFLHLNCRRRVMLQSKKGGQLAACLAAIVLFTAQAAIAEEKPWRNSAEVCFVQTEGNTDVLTLSASNTLAYRFTKNWLSEWRIAAFYGKTNGAKTSERYSTDFRLDYKTAKGPYGYTLTGLARDTFSGTNLRAHFGLGVGRRIEGRKNILTFESGMNYAREEYTRDGVKNFFEGRLFARYEHIFNPKTKFSQTAEYLCDLRDMDIFRVNSVTALTTALTDRLSLKVSYEVNYQHAPIPDWLKSTDKVISAAIVVDF